jgi:hypothetical protein
VQHPAERPCAAQFFRRVEVCIGFDGFEEGRKFPTAETRLLHTLTPGNSAPSHIGVFTRIIIGTGIRGQLEMGVDDIIDIAKEQACPLLPLLVDKNGELGLAAPCCLPRGAIRQFPTDLALRLTVSSRIGFST